MDPDSRNAALKPTYNKVEARVNPYFGTIVRKAEGAKTVRPSDPRTVREQDKPYTTSGMEYDAMMQSGVIPMDKITSLQKHYRRKMKYFETY